METNQKQTHQNIQQPGEKQQQHVSHFRFLLLIAWFYQTNHFVSDFDPKWAGPSTAQTWRTYNDTLRLCSIEPNRFVFALQTFPLAPPISINDNKQK